MPNFSQEEIQKKTAESLRRQIENLKEGQVQEQHPFNLREFIERKMAEDQHSHSESEDLSHE